MTRLIYHPLSSSSITSPFDECAVKVAQSGSIRIVSPYIGVSYLERLIGLAGEWQLITDVEAWLSSLSFRARPRAWSFIRKHLELIHHCPDIYAKHVLSKALAMMGSANLTHTGILGRTELGVLIDDPEMIREMQEWFAILWEQTAPPVVDEASAFVQWLDTAAVQAPARRQTATLSSETRKVRARLAALPPQPVATANAPLALATVAQTLIQAEHKHFESLDQALEAMLDTLAIQGFTLGDAAQYVREGLPDALSREIYFGVIRYTANHFRSVFAEDTINRLILTDGRFAQSTRETITAAFEYYDKFLAYLISNLSFFEAKEIPDEEQIEDDTGVPGAEQVMLLSELLECGFIQLEDLPGRLPLYVLDATFDWEGRYKLFGRAHQAWLTLSRQPRVTKAAIAPHEENYDDLAEFDDGPLDERLISRIEETWPPESKYQDSSIGRLSNIMSESKFMEEKARKRNLLEQVRMEMIDKTIALLLEMIFKGQKIRLNQSLELSIQLEGETGFYRKRIRQLLHGTLPHTPAIFKPVSIKNISPDVVLEILPTVELNELRQYPRSLTVCQNFLGNESHESLRSLNPDLSIP